MSFKSKADLRSGGDCRAATRGKYRDDPGGHPFGKLPGHFSLHKTLLRGIFSHHDTRPGGAWSPEGQDRNSGGIWNSIYLSTYDDYKIDRFKVTPQPFDGAAQIGIDFDLSRLHDQRPAAPIFGSPRRERIGVVLAPANFEGKRFESAFTAVPGRAQHFNMLIDAPDSGRPMIADFPTCTT